VPSKQEEHSGLHDVHLFISWYVPVGHVDEQVLLYKNVPFEQLVHKVDEF